ncbi:hypothetical protein ACB092_06G090900 [Castanea dentata]
MSLVQKFGKPDLCITITCNPGWEEIQNELLPIQTTQDRPDLLARVFKSKFEELKDDIVVKGFQKRGLPHAHMLTILDEDDKLHNPEDYDRVVKAEILCKEEQPQLHKAILKHMIHGPCRIQNPRSPYMKNGQCKKGYPKPFSPETYQGNDSYPVVPYNPWLLLKYNFLINVEICCSIECVKYLYKYVYKCPDRVSTEIRPIPNYDEVQQYIDARWVCALEACWKIFVFPIDIRMPSALRRLFATILIFCLPTGVRELWNEFYLYMVEDYPSTSHIAEYDLSILTRECDNDSTIPRLIQDELTVPKVDEELTLIEKLNNDQSVAYETIMTVIDCKESMIFFVDGLGGTGKTFLYRTILANLRKANHITIVTTTSSIVATLLPSGRTTHSRFKIPLTPDVLSTCSISKQSDLAELIRHATIIIWDEAPMVNRRALESLDRTFKDIMEVNLPFGGNVLILEGDFRQILPVVPNGTKAEMIDACIVKSPLWKDVKVLHLKQNMRSINDEEFAEYIQRIDNGNESFIIDDLIKLPPSMAMQWEGQHFIYNLIDQVFPSLQEHANDARYMLNANIISQFPRDEFTLHSFDEVERDTQHLYQQEFLNSISPGDLPPHIFRLKKGASVMLLCNIDPNAGLCNGTKLICRGYFNNVIDTKILIGQYVSTCVFLPRIPLKTKENVQMPFVMIRRQFVVRLSFAITINKAQGQTIPTVGIYLPDHIFSHDQLYVALLRGVSQSTTKLLVQKGTIPEEEGVHTRNIVYKDVLFPSS